MSAPPPIAASSPIHPALRPITSTTITRSWLSAVEWSRSTASVATCAAVRNPTVTSVPGRSLSIVFGTPIDRAGPRSARSAAAPSVPSPPIAMTPSAPIDAERRAHPPGTVVLAHRVDARAAEDRPAAGQDAADRRRGRARAIAASRRPRPSVLDADERVAGAGARPDHGADHGVQAGAVAAAGEDRETHAPHPTGRTPIGRDVSRARRRAAARRGGVLGGGGVLAALRGRTLRLRGGLLVLAAPQDLVPRVLVGGLCRTARRPPRPPRRPMPPCGAR